MTYNDFINRILESRGRFGCGEEYHERHHILPKCLGGSNDKENLIDLFAREHFIAHKLLFEENPDNRSLAQAYSMMAFTKNNEQKDQRYELTPEEYEEARIRFSNFMKEYYKDKTKHPCYGKHLSEERKAIISKANKGNKYCVGRVVSEETRKKISLANSNPSKETRKKMSEAQKARNLNGANNPKAKAVIRLSDKKIYGSAKEAATENNINYSTFKARIHKKQGDFMYLEDYKKSNSL